jgi:hypothetical protein
MIFFNILFNLIYMLSNLYFVFKSINPLQLIYLTLLKCLLFTPSSTAKESDWSVFCTERSRRYIPLFSLFPSRQILTSNSEAFSEPILVLPSENHPSSNPIILFVFFWYSYGYRALDCPWWQLLLTNFHPAVFGKCVLFMSTLWSKSSLAGNYFQASPVLS